MKKEIVVHSEVAGTVYEILCAPGAMVAEGQDLLVVESMKMEVPVAAPCAGRIVRLIADKGMAVAADQPLIALELVQQ